MKYIIYGVIGIAVLGFLFMDQGGASKPKINLTEVLNRSTIAMERFDKYLKENNIEKATDQHLQILSELAQMFSGRDVRQSLNDAVDADTAQRVIIEWEPHAPDQRRAAV